MTSRTPKRDTFDVPSGAGGVPSRSPLSSPVSFQLSSLRSSNPSPAAAASHTSATLPMDVAHMTAEERKELRERVASRRGQEHPSGGFASSPSHLDDLADLGRSTASLTGTGASLDFPLSSPTTGSQVRYKSRLTTTTSSLTSTSSNYAPSPTFTGHSHPRTSPIALQMADSEGLRAKVVELESQVNAKDISMQILRERMTVLDSSLASCTTSLESQKTVRLELEARVLSLESIVAERDAETDRAVRATEKERRLREAAEAEAAQARSEAIHSVQIGEESRGKLSVQLSHAAEMKLRHASQIDELNATIKALQTQLEDALEDARRAHERAEQLALQQVPLPQPDNASAIEILHLSDALRSAQLSATQSESRLEAAMETHRSTVQKKEQKITRLEEEVKAERERHSRDRESQRGELEESQQTLSRQLTISETNLRELQSQYNLLQMRLTDAETQSRSLSVERDRLNESLIASRNSSHVTREASVETGLLQTLLSKLDAELHLRERERQDKKHEGRETHDSHARDLAALHQQISDLQSDVSRAQSLQADAAHRAASAEARANAASEEKAQIVGAISSLEAQLVQARNETILATAERIEKSLLYESSAEKLRELQSKVDSLSRDYDALQKKENDQARALIAAEMELSTLREQLHQAEASLLSQNQTIAALQGMEDLIAEINREVKTGFSEASLQRGDMQSKINEMALRAENARRASLAAARAGGSGIPTLAPQTVRVSRTESKLRPNNNATKVSTRPGEMDKNQEGEQLLGASGNVHDPVRATLTRLESRMEELTSAFGRDLQVAQSHRREVAQDVLTQLIGALNGIEDNLHRKNEVSQSKLAADIVNAVQDSLNKRADENQTRLIQTVSSVSKSSATELLTQLTSVWNQSEQGLSRRNDEGLTRIVASFNASEDSWSRRTEELQARILNAIKGSVEGLTNRAEESHRLTLSTLASVEENLSRKEEESLVKLSSEIQQTHDTGVRKVELAQSKILNAISSVEPRGDDESNSVKGTDARHWVRVEKLLQSAEEMSSVQAQAAQESSRTQQDALKRLNTQVEAVHARLDEIQSLNDGVKSSTDSFKRLSAQIDTLRSTLQDSQQDVQKALQGCDKKLVQLILSSDHADFEHKSLTILQELLHSAGARAEFEEKALVSLAEVARVSQLQQEHDELLGILDGHFKELREGQVELQEAQQVVLNALPQMKEEEVRMDAVLRKISEKVEELVQFQFPELPQLETPALASSSSSSEDELDERTLDASAAVFDNIWSLFRRMVNDAVIAQTLPTGAPRSDALDSLVIHPQDRQQLVQFIELLPPAMKKHVLSVMQAFGRKGSPNAHPLELLREAVHDVHDTVKRYRSTSNKSSSSCSSRSLMIGLLALVFACVTSGVYLIPSTCQAPSAETLEENGLASSGRGGWGLHV